MLNDEHYDGGITEQTALTVKNATPNDMGFYKCILQNNAGISISEQTVEVSVFCTYHSQITAVIANHMKRGQTKSRIARILSRIIKFRITTNLNLRNMRYLSEKKYHLLS